MLSGCSVPAVTVVISFAILPVCAAPTDIFVAPGGNDDAAGTQAAPFATLQRAQEAVRELRAADDFTGVTVHV
ncbi:MAG: hypothetical protein J7M38_15735, partial [Armatimonadetes bacterium]|nr:hypothetical protein [Armatimonadota bacterium]